MVIQPVKLILLNHLFYYTEVSGGSTSASITGAFIGDLALTFALQKVIAASEDIYLHRDRPVYEDILKFGFYCTIGRPVHTSRTDSYIRNTLLSCDGFPDLKNIAQSGRTPYKNYRQVQGIQVQSEFQALILSKSGIDLPPALRIGSQRETLVTIEKTDLKNVSRDFWLNAYTLRTVFKNLDNAVEVLTREKKINFSYLLENYAFIKQLSADNIEEIFQNQF
jgi:CRISPR-associated protein Csc1